jgi:phytoene dehydrogenase-like protein
MLGGKYRDEHINKLYYSGKYEPKTSGFHIAAGVARKFDESFKPLVVFDMKNPITVDGKEIKTLGVTVYNFDPGAAPKGHTVLTAVVESNAPNYWINLRNSNKQEYDRQKDVIAKHVIDELENHFGNIRNNLKMVDVATPATYVRYTNNWNGALMGWTDFNLYVHKPKKEIKGLKNFYMCGQWTGDAGLPGAAISGREVTRIICKRDNKDFKALTF